jgi:oxygen-independent coproporphyrinogen-3 oxidase
VAGRRWQNVAATEDYVTRVAAGDSPALPGRTVSAQGQVEEALFMGLRMVDGIDGEAFLARFGVDPWARYAEALEPFVQGGQVWHRDRRFGLTRQGMLIANTVLETFV